MNYLRNQLTASQVARETGYSKERIRQLSITTNKKNVLVLAKHFTMENGHRIYTQEVIPLLLKLKQIKTRGSYTKKKVAKKKVAITKVPPLHLYTKKEEPKIKVIILTQGQFAIVDEKDYQELNKHKWLAAKVKNENTYYAMRSVGGLGKQKVITMHRVILQTPNGVETDHINHNGLDNRRENLRICTRSQNMMNQIKQKNTSSKYKGVSFYRKTKKWISRIKLNQKATHLGYFHTEEDAALAYNEAAKKLFGSFANLNVIK